jgi:hypothetical protein
LSPAVERVSFNVSPFHLDVDLPLGLYGRNPDMLSITLGTQTTDELGESLLGAKTNDPESLDRWRAIRKAAAAELHRGAWAVNSRTGDRSFVRDHYYSDGAAGMFYQGTRMSTFSNLIVYEFTESGADS